MAVANRPTVLKDVGLVVAVRWVCDVKPAFRISMYVVRDTNQPTNQPINQLSVAVCGVYDTGVRVKVCMWARKGFVVRRLRFVVLLGA